MTVDETRVDEMVVDETGVDELGCYLPDCAINALTGDKHCSFTTHSGKILLLFMSNLRYSTV